MQLSSILSNIPFLKNLRSEAGQSQGVSEQSDKVSSSAPSVEDIRRQAIEDTVEISPSASRSLEQLDTEAELSKEEVLSILDSTRSVLESNDNFSLGLDQTRAQNL